MQQGQVAQFGQDQVVIRGEAAGFLGTSGFEKHDQGTLLVSTQKLLVLFACLGRPTVSASDVQRRILCASLWGSILFFIDMRGKLALSTLSRWIQPRRLHLSVRGSATPRCVV